MPRRRGRHHAKYPAGHGIHAPRRTRRRRRPVRGREGYTLDVDPDAIDALRWCPRPRRRRRCGAPVTRGRRARRAHGRRPCSARGGPRGRRRRERLLPQPGAPGRGPTGLIEDSLSARIDLGSAADVDVVEAADAWFRASGGGDEAAVAQCRPAALDQPWTRRWRFRCVRHPSGSGSARHAEPAERSARSGEPGGLWSDAARS